MDRMVDLESGSIHELKPVPGMWQYPNNPKLCCIYRVPNCLRQVSPEAYTPQLVLIGPLHHSLKYEALKYLGDITNVKSMGYLNMEAQKKNYLNEFIARFKEENITDEFRTKIKEEEDKIRASYSKSTTWIQSTKFVEMILLDSVFIFQHMWKLFKRTQGEKTGDPLMDEPCLEIAVRRDLMLLENQLPYFILEKLYEPRFLDNKDFRKKIITYFFGFENKISIVSEFSHFTDLLRCALVKTVLHHPSKTHHPSERSGKIGHMYTANKLHSGGVRFKAAEDDVFKVEFKKGCLKLPCLMDDDEFEITIRNVMALEQCHDPFNALVCNYVIFLDCLIDTDKDVELLAEKGNPFYRLYRSP